MFDRADHMTFILLNFIPKVERMSSCNNNVVELKIVMITKYGEIYQNDSHYFMVSNI